MKVTRNNFWKEHSIIFQIIFINYQLIIFMISMDTKLTERLGNDLPLVVLL